MSSSCCRERHSCMSYEVIYNQWIVCLSRGSSFLSLITNKTNTWLYYMTNKVCVSKRNRNCLPSVSTWDHIGLFGAICVALLLSFLCSVFCSVSLSSISCVYMHWLSILGYSFGFSLTFSFKTDLNLNLPLSYALPQGRSFWRTLMWHKMLNLYNMLNESALIVASPRLILCFLAHSGAHHIWCCVLVCLSIFCVPYVRQFPWNVHFWLPFGIL
jgi:hypothetical protein